VVALGQSAGRLVRSRFLLIGEVDSPIIELAVETVGQEVVGELMDFALVAGTVDRSLPSGSTRQLIE
jgi:hypothetical protein